MNIYIAYDNKGNLTEQPKPLLVLQIHNLSIKTCKSVDFYMTVLPYSVSSQLTVPGWLV